MNWEEEIEHIIHSFEKEIESVKLDSDQYNKSTYMYINGRADGQKSIISRLQVALDEARKSKFTD